MERTWFFQFDCSADNDGFFAGSNLYRGKRFRVGAWEPDGLRVDLTGHHPARCIVTLIELEAKKSDVWMSARKYLPEEPEEVLETFRDYLKRVIRECRTTADPRRPALCELERALQGRGIEIKTAGALREASWIQPMLEELPVVGRDGLRPQYLRTKESKVQVEPESAQVFPTRGTGVKLDQQGAKALLRCLLVLDASIRGLDHSNADFRNFRVKAPLRRSLRDRGENLSELMRFLGRDESNSGLTLDFESILRETAELWSESKPGIDTERVYQMICRYFPSALQIRQTDKMSRIFSDPILADFRARAAPPR